MIKYDENIGQFIIKDKIFSSKQIDEKDLSINKINELKEKAELSILTQEDIDMLYSFYCHEFNNHGIDKDNFVNIPLKDLFIGLDNKNLILNNLIPLANQYERAIEKGLEKPIIEKFVDVSRSTRWNINIFIICSAFIIMLIFIYFMLLRYYI